MSGTAHDGRTTSGAPRPEGQHLSPPASPSTSFGVGHPRWWIATVAVLATLAVLVLTTTRPARASLESELLLDGIVVVAALLIALPGIWSLRHPERARAIATQHQLEREDFMAHHRLRAWVGTPLVGAGAALLRTPRFFPHPGPAQFAIAGLSGAVLGLLLVSGVALSVRSRRSRHGA